MAEHKVYHMAEFCSAILPALPKITALTGGGGKTTLLYGLGKHLATAGKSTVITTTTKIGIDPNMINAASPEELNKLIHPGTCILAGRPLNDKKAVGIPQDWYAALCAEHITVEADGSRHMPLKCHRSCEPVIPAGTGLVIQLMGLSALGKPAGEAVHCAEEAGIKADAVVTPRLAAELLLRGFSHSGYSGRSIAVLNQADTLPSLDTAEEIKNILTREGFETYITQLNR